MSALFCKITNRQNPLIAYILHLKNYTLVLDGTTLQRNTFTLKCLCIKRKCVKMIQPIGAFSPRADFRGRGVQRKAQETPQERSKAQVALINAAGTSIVAGALTTAVARSYTSSWAHAGILGVCGSVLSMFFIAPMLVENTTLLKSKKKHNLAAVQKESTKTSTILKDSFKAPKKLIQFKQS